MSPPNFDSPDFAPPWRLPSWPLLKGAAYGVEGVPVFVIEGRGTDKAQGPVYIVRGQVTLRRALRHVLERRGDENRDLAAFLTEALGRLPAGAAP